MLLMVQASSYFDAYRYILGTSWHYWDQRDFLTLTHSLSLATWKGLVTFYQQANEIFILSFSTL